MSEGRTYRCTWRRATTGEIEAWLEGHPNIRSIAPVPDDVLRQLADRIIERFGDGEPQFDFDPPLPVPPVAADVDLDTYVTLFPNGGMSVDNAPGTLVTGPICPTCGVRQRGRRTTDQLSVVLHGPSAIAPDADNGYVMVASANFLAELTDAERSAFDARPIQLPPGARRRAMEVVPKAFVPECGVRGVPVAYGMRCIACGLVSFSHGATVGWLVGVCRDDLPRQPPPLFFAGSQRHFHLVVLSARWRELRRQPGASAWTSSPVALVGGGDCLRHPPLPTISERDEQRQRTGKFFDYARWLAERPTS